GVLAAFTPVGSEVETQGPRNHPRRWMTAACPGCGGVILAELDPSDRTIWGIHPEFVGQWEVRHLPDEVQLEWDEAVRGFRAGVTTGAVVSCGRTLEAAASAFFIAGKNL